MLLKFKVSNFRSISELQEFNMLSGSTRSKHEHIHEVGDLRILKNTAMYGANAAGKSAFVNAMEISKLFILHSIDTVTNVKKSYCRAKQENMKKSSYFEYMMSIGDKFYSYGFEVVLSEARLESEWLIELNDSLLEKNVIFQRDCGSNNEFAFGKGFTKDDLSRLNIYASDMSGKTSKMFLTEMSSKNLNECLNLRVFRNIFDWFDKKRVVNVVKMPDKKDLAAAGKILKDMDTDISNISYNLISKKELNAYDQNAINGIDQFLRESARNGRNEVFINPRDWVMFELGPNGLKVSKIRTLHGNENPFDVDEESTGTKEILLMISVLTGEDDDITYVRDEFGNGLHPNLSYRFMELFQEHNRNRSCQLIVTTHETKLMTLDLYRRDEIWFVEKDNGESVIYSLEEFRERFDKKLSNAYFDGRYGALPVFGELNKR